jgi:hypothetical protein
MRQQILIKLDSPPLEAHNNARSSKLEISHFFTFLHLSSWSLEVLVEPLHRSATRSGVSRQNHLLHSPHLHRSNGDKKHLAKLLTLNLDRSPRIVCKDIDSAANRERINTEVIPGDLLPPFDGPVHRAVVAVVVLRRQPERRDRSRVPNSPRFLILSQILNRKMLAFDPNCARLWDRVIDDDAAVSGDNSSTLIPHPPFSQSVPMEKRACALLPDRQAYKSGAHSAYVSL